MEKLSNSSGMRLHIQKFGKSLSGMVMPNIGAFIAWGLITAFFIPTGWWPNESLASMVDPMIKYLLPLLVAYTGGKAVGGQRGGVIGTIAAMGVIVGADIPMFLGAMVAGPLAGFVIKKFDQAIEGKVKAGFEMLINNFSIGILGMLMAILGFYAIGPIVETITLFLQYGVGIIVHYGILPLVSIFVEPAKILFLNNAINHGIFGPLGIEQVAETGKSIMFLIETNPGPGLGVLLAYWMFAKGAIKDSAPGAIIIHFFGGIHEIYFPYVLMNPALILAVIGGGMAGVLVFTILGAGLVATPSPGSIFAIMALAPKGGLLPVLLGVAAATAVSFLIASIFVKRAASKDLSLDSAQAAVKSMKSAGISAKEAKGVSEIIFACDAGMGSSAMGATMLRKKLKDAGININVTHSSVDDVQSDAQMVVTQNALVDRVKAKAPKAQIVPIDNFMNAPEYDEIVNSFKK